MGGLLNVVRRLASGATPEQAQAELALIARRIEQEHPSLQPGWGVHVVPLHEATVKDVRAALLVLFGSVGILLLIACANVAEPDLEPRRHTSDGTGNPSLARRDRRTACRQFLTESLVLAAAGGALGACWPRCGERQLLVSALPAGLDLPRAREIGVDLRILAFASFVTILTAILFGLVPSMSAVRDRRRNRRSARRTRLVGRPQPDAASAARSSSRRWRWR